MSRLRITESDALIVVDVQNDFCPGGSLAVPGGDEVVKPINRMIRIFYRPAGGFVVTTQDWHPLKTKHFDPVEDGGEGWPVHCVRKTAGAKLHPHLMHPHAPFFKGDDPVKGAYSAFEARDLDNIMLNEALKQAGIKRVFVCGLATDYCIKATVLDALKLGYETYVLVDCVRAVNLNGAHDGEAALTEMAVAGATLIASTYIT